MNASSIALASVTLMVAGLFAAPLLTASAQQAASLSSSSLTLDTGQVTRGRQAAGQHCGECHGVSLRGAAGPALRGDGFLAAWGDQTAAALFDYAQTRMPPASPGALPEAVYTDIIVFVLSNNGFAAANGAGEIARAGLSEIAIR